MGKIKNCIKSIEISILNDGSKAVYISRYDDPGRVNKYWNVTQSTVNRIKKLSQDKNLTGQIFNHGGVLILNQL